MSPFAARTPISFAGAPTSSRHRDYQDARMAEQPGYRLEVPLAGSFSHGEWTVLVHGRADGVFGIGGGPEAWRVEEVKTGFGPLVPGSRRARAYALQAALYGWLLQRETGLPTEATVIWLAGGEEPERIPVRWSPVELVARTRRSGRPTLHGAPVSASWPTPPGRRSRRETTCSSTPRPARARPQPCCSPLRSTHSPTIAG
jgi:hypothetical protein